MFLYFIVNKTQHMLTKLKNGYMDTWKKKPKGHRIT